MSYIIVIVIALGTGLIFGGFNRSRKRSDIYEIRLSAEGLRAIIFNSTRYDLLVAEYPCIVNIDEKKKIVYFDSYYYIFEAGYLLNVDPECDDRETGLRDYFIKYLNWTFKAVEFC